MTTKNREGTIAELRRAIAESAARGDAQGIPRETRRHVLEFTADEKSAGRTARATASLLGIHETTLSRWSRELVPRGRRPRRPKPDGEFRAVLVREEASSDSKLARAPVVPRSALRVAHAASGLVIDGLDMEGLASLLRSLS